MKFIELEPETVQVPHPYKLDDALASPGSPDQASAIMFYSLCEATRRGDSDRVRYLVEVENVPLNQRDVWDSSPLYYACLCGHKELVRYLLDNGARCEPNTFEAERCYYGALNEDIRNLLKAFNFSKAIDELQPYAAFMYKLHMNPSATYGDITFRVLKSNVEIHAHRCIMAARSKYFRTQFLRRWKYIRIIDVKHSKFHVPCFQIVLMWMYTGRIELGLLKGRHELLSDLLLMARLWKLDEMQERLKAQLGFNRLTGSSNANERQGAHVGIEKVQQDFQQLIKLIGTSRSTLTVMMLSASVFADVLIQVDNQYFAVHKAFLGGQSEYFKAYFSGYFAEGRQSLENNTDGVPMIPIVPLDDPNGHLTPEIFKLLLEYIYTDHVSIPSDSFSTAYSLLVVSDMFLLDKLKSLTVVVLSGLLASITRGVHRSALEKVNQQEVTLDIDVFELTQVAIDMHLERLEQHCVQFFAFHFDEYALKPEFKELIQYSAESIQDRQETDTIPFVDDIRWYLTHLKDEDVLDKAREHIKMTKHTREDSGNVFVGQLDYLRRMRELDDILDELGFNI